MAGPYPLSTLAATVDATGIRAPSLSDILASLQASYQGIFGSDAYLEPDGQDGQWLGILAAAINDSNQTAIAVYNGYSPATAQGADLSSVVKINGLRRQSASNSSAVVTIIGQAGTQITNGLVGDNVSAGTQWALPSPVNVPISGSIDVTAICTLPGAVTADVATLTKILTPSAGWQSVSNAAAATVGAAIETDAQLRQRQTVSTELPSLTVTDGILGALLNLPGVSQGVIHENYTGSTDSDGVPAHTIACVIAGGDAQRIINTIGLKKSPGCGTYGSSSGTYVDPFGITYTLHYSVPTQKRIVMAVTVHALTGYTTSIGDEIKTALAAYINALSIGSDVLITRLYAPALLQGPYGQAAAANPNDAFTFEIVSLAAAIFPVSPSTTDINIAFDQVAVCSTTDISVTVV